MATVTHLYIVGQTVFTIDANNVVKQGVVQAVDIDINASGTIIAYWVLVAGAGPLQRFLEANVFGSCQAAPGFQDVVFLNDLTGSPSGVAISGSPLPGLVFGSPIALLFSVDVVIDGTTTISLSLTPVGGETYADIIIALNAQLGVFATASLVQNSIRITSATIGITSSVVIAPGSPQIENYFRFLTGFTGLAASFIGLGPGAFETLSTNVCPR